LGKFASTHLIACLFFYLFLAFQVEGEIDKLSMDEAGYRNCVSVPDGAPPKVSSKIPDKEQVRTILYFPMLLKVLISVMIYICLYTTTR
jgi:hypothetical protein